MSIRRKRHLTPNDIAKSSDPRGIEFEPTVSCKTLTFGSCSNLLLKTFLAPSLGSNA